MVRCKFRCNSVTKRDQGQGKFHYDVSMGPVYSQVPDTENKKFWDATPCGKFEMSTIKECEFEPGKSYYIDLTEAPD